MELIRYQTVGLSVKEITSLVEDNYMENYSAYLERYYYELQGEITYKCLLKERIKEMMLRAKTSQMNLEKYWFKEIPAHNLFFLCNESDDEYDKISFSKSEKDILFNDKNFAFYESIVLFEKTQNTWWYGINREYALDLSLQYDCNKSIKKELCLCTMIDMGEIGTFNRNLLNPVHAYMEENGYHMNGIIRGMIVCRGYQNGIYQRVLEIQVPIKH